MGTGAEARRISRPAGARSRLPVGPPFSAWDPRERGSLWPGFSLLVPPCAPPALLRSSACSRVTTARREPGLRDWSTASGLLIWQPRKDRLFFSRDLRHCGVPFRLG